MTVKELIEKLQKYKNQNEVVCLREPASDEAVEITSVSTEALFDDDLFPVSTEPEGDDEERSYSDYCILS